MNITWIWFVAARYIFRGRKNSPSPALAILGIATGVLALIVIIAVMNGFQLSFIESILEISSAHVRIESFSEENTEEGRAMLLDIPGISAALPFREFQGLARGGRGGQQAVVIRGVPPDAPELDRALGARLEFEDGSFALDKGRPVLLGAELARRLGVKTGDDITLFSISGILAGADGGEAGDESAGIAAFTVTGIFRTGFYEYDTGWGFVNIKDAAAFSEQGPVLGIKLKNRFQDRYALEQAKKALAGIPGFEDAKLSSWRDYNRSFFGALRTEKLCMFILVGLIFIVVGLNIYQAQRRAVLEHREEIGLLRAVGGGEQAVRFVFVCDGAIIGCTGTAAGLALGLLIASNIPLFFAGIETVVNFFIQAVNSFAARADIGSAGEFAVFSPRVFYIKEIPSRIIPHEVALICMFGLFSALLAAWFASGKVARIHPAEVLRYE
jgi:lipoprotein-releasing system permease protein